MDIQPRRTFKPEVRPPTGRADALRDRMRTTKPDQTQPAASPPVSDRPIGGDETPLKPVSQQIQVAEDSISQPQPTSQVEPPRPIHETWQPSAPAQAVESPQPAVRQPIPPVESEPPEPAIEADQPDYSQSTPVNTDDFAEQQPSDTNRRGSHTLAKLKSFKLPKIRRSDKPELSSSQKFFRNTAIGGALLLVFAIGSFAVYGKTLGSHNPTIPADLQLKSKFSLYYPPKNDKVKIDKETFKYDPQAGLMSYVAYTPSNVKLIVSEQAAPDNWTSGNPAYNTLLKSLPGVKSFKTASGTASLTHPTQAGQDQFGFMNANGTMLIIRPSKELPDQEWQKIFNSLEAVKESE